MYIFKVQYPRYNKIQVQWTIERHDIHTMTAQCI